MPRQRKPNAQHVIDGTYEFAAHGPVDSNIEPGLPTAPAGLTERQIRLFDEVAQTLNDANLLTKADVYSIRLFVVLQSAFEEDPVAFTTSRLQLLRGALADLGLTPAARRKVPPVKSNTAADGFDLD